MKRPERSLRVPGDLRGPVAAVLEDLNQPTEVLGTESPHASWRHHIVPGTDVHDGLYAPSRIRLHESLIEAYLARQTEVEPEGFAAVVTAGPPAAGKSTRLDDLGYGPEWRRIDPDELKVMLIEHALAAGDLPDPAWTSRTAVR